MRNYPALQIMTLILFQAIYQALFIWTKPYAAGHGIAFFTEFMILLYLYATLLLTDYVFIEDIDALILFRDFAGWMLLAVILTTSGVNLGSFFVQIVAKTV